MKPELSPSSMHSRVCMQIGDLRDGGIMLGLQGVRAQWAANPYMRNFLYAWVGHTTLPPGSTPGAEVPA
jgi:hypothetical protein